MGAGSSFKHRVQKQSNGITDLPGVDNMGDLTPFQNQVLDYAAKVEKEEQERKQQEARNGNSGRTRNPRAGSNGSPNSSDLGQEETVRYVNKDLNPDHKVH